MMRKTQRQKIQEIEHKIELLILNLAVFCFKRGFSIDKFVDVLENMSSLEDKTKIPFDQLPNETLTTTETSRKNRKETQEIKSKKQLVQNDYNITADSLEEYSRVFNKQTIIRKIYDLKELEETKRQPKGLQNKSMNQN